MMPDRYYNILDRCHYATQFWIEHREKLRGRYFSFFNYNLRLIYDHARAHKNAMNFYNQELADESCITVTSKYNYLLSMVLF
jgi:hypothetical protein